MTVLASILCFFSLLTGEANADPVEFLNGRFKQGPPTLEILRAGRGRGRYEGDDWRCLTQTSYAGMPFCEHESTLADVDVTHTLLFCDDEGEELCLEVFESRKFAITPHLKTAAKKWMQELSLEGANWEKGTEPTGETIAFQAKDGVEVILLPRTDTLVASTGRDAYFLVYRMSRIRQARIARIIEEEKRRTETADAEFFGSAALSAQGNERASCLDTCDMDVCFGEESILLDALNEVLTRRFFSGVRRYAGSDGSFRGTVGDVRFRGTYTTPEGQAQRTEEHQSYVSAYQGLATDMASTAAYQCWSTGFGRSDEDVLESVNRMVDHYNDWNRARNEEE